MIPRPLARPLLASVVFANAKAKRLAIRLTRWTGKSREYVHRVLDVGCGHGMHALKAAALCRWVDGVDRAHPEENAGFFAVCAVE